jgi:23S rRNA pseudouridine2604 synthase
VEPIPYPVRINKYLALVGEDTRRGADVLVKAGIVFINGKRAEPGQWVNAGAKVELKRKAKKYAYFAYNKPFGVITHSPQEGEKDIKQVTRKSALPADVFPLGRLDKNSHGLILLTNDGRITDRLLHPSYAHEKEYVVKVQNKLQGNFKRVMERGVDIEGYVTKPCTVKVLDDHTFSIRLTEGKKHQIRRMVVALKNDVANLKRTRIMNVELGRLAPGAFRPIEGEELAAFLESLGL